MMPTKELTDVLKSAQTATSLSGQSLICVDSLGNPRKVSAPTINQKLMAVDSVYVSDFNEATTAGVYALHGSMNPSNGPEGINMILGMLEVYDRGGSTGLLYQRAISYQGVIGVRTRYCGSWTPWRILT